MIDQNQTGRGERPIQRREDDYLERASFVDRLTSALITDDNQAARGVVVGVTGSWGSGKSSVLNLVALAIKVRNPQAVVVRFDPWVISGQQDLILSFLRDTIRTVADEPAHAQGARKLIKALKLYAAHLAPLVDLAHRGLGGAVRGFFEGLGIFVAGDESLAGQRKRLQELIGLLKVPVVVLIDELDRVEDDEVRSVAQLVRAVGDFQGVSYLLAYDPARVARALGSGKPGQRSETHGRSYLEKIVQLPLALPVALPEELRRMLDAEVRQVCDSLELSADVVADDRYGAIADAITPNLAATPRDIKRVVGIFNPLAAMVKSEVDLVDVLGCAALMAKAPRTVENLTRDPEAVVDDPLTFRENRRRSDRQRGVPTATTPTIVPTEEAAAYALVLRLFPVLTGRQSDTATHTNPVSRRRGLMTVMRLGLLPGAVSSDEANQLLEATQAEAVARFEQAIASDNLSELIDRLADIYPSRFMSNDLGFWKGASQVLNATDRPLDERFGLLNALADNLTQMLDVAVARQADMNDKAERLVSELPDDLMLVPRWIFDHLQVHGLGPNGQLISSPRGGAWFLSAPQTMGYANTLSDRWRDSLRNHKLLDRLNSPVPLYIMTRLGFWDQNCRSLLSGKLPTFAPKLAALLFSPNTSVEAGFLESLCGLNHFLRCAQSALEDLALSPLERAALERALTKLSKPDEAAEFDEGS